MINIAKDKQFLKNLYILALPIIINDLLNALINMMDTFMIGKLGAESVSAVSLGNQVFFIFNLFMFGICSGATVFFGQYWGARDVKGVRKVFGITIILAMIVATLFVCVATIFPEIAMRIYSKDDVVVNLGVRYLKVVGFSYYFIAVTMAFNAASKATGFAYFPMITTFISLITNVVLNYIFIFKMNMGVIGAAYGTFCARFLEMSVVVAIVLIKKLPVYGNIRDYFHIDKVFMQNFVKVSLPVMLNEAMWGLGTTGYNIAFKYSGTVAQAAVQIATVTQQMFTVAGMGIASASGILISNCLGARDEDRALDYAHKCTITTVFISIVLGIILAFNTENVVSLFDIGNVGRDYAIKMLYVVAVGIVLKGINYLNVVGILRSGGDTIFTLILDSGGVWLIGIPMAFLGAYFLELPIYISFAMVYTEEAIKVLFSEYRVLIKKKWIKTVI